ncbi:metallophosphoesterase family protein [Sanguibacter suaedae]|uniref:Metallophosphoesterase n=1 Tax=Sanguibacter suaedae TaxID=2795737 RepID=A0A934I2I6_9MICO|nr:metallophosphoesterase [Sanguibacter suaedae]MBI9114394.1 metallophosphoesterase [Sanguibacter suaedae]
MGPQPPHPPRTRAQDLLDRVRAHPPHSAPVPPRWLRRTLVVTLVVLSCALFGVAGARTEASLGPHNATYEVTMNAIATVDLGPLGTVQLRSPAPGPLGVRVTIEEIPDDLQFVDSSTTLDALASDVEGYLQFFGGPQETVAFVVGALVQDAIRRTVAALLVVLVVAVAGYFVLGPGRRLELSRPLARRTWELTTVAVVVALVAGVTTAGRVEERLQAVGSQASPVFDGTPLEGARITGRLSGVIDTYGGQLVDVYRDNESFYAQADRNLHTAWAERAELLEQSGTRLEENVPARSTADPTDPASSTDPDDPAPDGTEGTDGTAGAPEGTGSAGPEEAGEGSDRPAAGEQTDEAEEGAGEPPAQVPDVIAPQDQDVVTLLMITDLHCNTGMTPLIRSVAELSGADVVLNGGDTTINGTAVERFCMESFASAVPSGARMVQADGNHDSELTSQHAAEAGVTVLDGQIVDVAGVRILGDSDPNETRIGQGSTSVDGETYLEAGERLRDVACEARDPADILLIHTPKVGEPVLASGCVPVQLSGHFHTRYGPLRNGLGIRYIGSSTAGSVEGQPTVGPLNGDAEMTVFRFDRERRVMLDYQIVQVRPDASVEVGARLAFPQPPVVEADEGGTTEGGAGDDAGGADEPRDETTEGVAEE